MALNRLPQNENLSKRAVEILRLLAEGRSDREIAEQLVMTINTIKWYNRQIYSILGVGSRTQAIARAHELQLLDEDSPPFQVVHTTSKHNLPLETTHFIGRKSEIADATRLLESARLLTLVGPPGTGKTRLALQIGWAAADSFRDGVYFVSLAPISDPALVTHAIASAVGATETQSQPLIETLKRLFRDKQLLLILDNFEHLLPAATVVSELFAAAPHIKVLATSREPLHLYGEQEYAVPPLALPDPAQIDLQTLADCESVALFMQAARAVRSDFDLTADNAPAIAQLCVRLDGLPLAIELAAARIKLLTPPALLNRLSSRLDTLTGGAQDLPTRQQTLRSTIEWSYNLLDEREKILFARLAIFRGGRSLEAIEAVCGGDLSVDVFDCLESLMNKSLIQQNESPEGEPRFIMLETIHEYAWERLRASGETDTMQRRHAQYFVPLAERAEPEMRLGQQRYWFTLLETEHENMRAVLRWSLDGGDKILGVRLVGALFLFWYAYGHHIEGQRWTQQMLEHQDAVPAAYRAKLLLAAGHLTMLYELETARDYFERALRLFRELQDEFNTAWALIFLGYTMMTSNETAWATADEGLALFRRMNHKPGIAQALNILGEVARFNGDDSRARIAYEECLVIVHETGEARRMRFMLSNLSFIALHEGDYVRARELGEQALRLSLEMNNRLDTADVMAGLAGIIGIMGEPERAARLLGAYEAVMERMGAVAQPTNVPENDRSIAVVRAQLDEATFDSAWAAGRSMTLEQAAALALENSES
jgi:predicted ATPase/DNA-binding CsgD family transcriptional regulator